MKPEGDPYDLDDEHGFLTMAEKASGQLTLTAPDRLLDAVAWTQRNPVAWRVIVRWAHRDADNGIRPSTRLYLCLLRHPFFAQELGLERMPGDKVLVNDHLSAALGRLLEREYGLDCGKREAACDSWRAP